MAELNRDKLVNAGALQDVAKGVYDQVQADIDAVEGQIADATLFETDMVTVSALGGIKAGQDLNGMTVQEVLTKLLYPHVDQVVGTVSTTPGASTREHGNYQTVTQVSAPVTKKSNPITKVELYKGSTLIDTKTEMPNGGTATFAGLSEATVNGTKFTIKAYALGENGVEKAVSKDSSSFVYVYPFYWGVMPAGATVDGAMVTGLTKVIEGKAQKAYTYTTSQNHAVIAYPKAHGKLKSILDPNNFENLAAFTCHEVKVTGLDKTEQDYYVYVSGASSVTNFKYTFKF